MTTNTSQHRTSPGSLLDAYPLSRLQAGMIYHAELEGDPSYYHDIYSLRVRGPWHEQAFRVALDGLVAAHDTLRTSFDLTRFSEPLQLVHGAIDVPIEVVDLRATERTAAEQVLADWRSAEIRRPFDLGRAPLFRVVVHVLRDDEFQFWWSFHHGIMDGWSLHSAVAELFAGYTAVRQGRSPELTAPKTRYRNYIALELEALEEPEHREFWLGQLAGAQPGTLPIPPRRTAGPDESTVDVRWEDVPADLLSRLNHLADELRVPVRTLLLAAHLRVTSGLLGRSDVITGVIANGRPETRDADRVKGLFLTTYPLRTQLTETSWAEFVKAVFDQENAVVPHRRFPLAAIVEDTGWSPFDIVFDFRRFRTYSALSANEDLAFDIGAYYEHTNYPMTSGFVMDPEGTSLRLQLRYDNRRFDTADTARIARSYLAVLTDLATRPDASVLARPPMADEDLRALAEAATGPTHRVAGSSLHAEVAAAAVASRTAVRAIDGDVTYAELLDIAARTAGFLRAQGVRPGEAVGVCMHRGRALIPTLLGVLWAGGNYVPLDPDYPMERLEYIARHSGARFVLHDRSAAGVAAGLSPAALPVEDAAAHPEPAEPTPVSGDDIAYTIYTSGSTGLPKGVQVRHASVLNLLRSLIATLEHDEEFTYLATTSVSFDIHVNEIFVPLILGATVLLAAREQISDGSALRSLIEAEPELVAQGPPAMWRLLLDAGWRPYGMSAVLCGGEAFPRDLAGRLTGDGVPVWNMYGPTETTVWSAVHHVHDGRRAVPIGRPLWNTTMWVLDDRMHPTLPGVPGELYLGGAGVARAYHDRPDLTADRFVPDPFAGAQQPGARLYRTGDLVRLAADGTFEFLERVDLQVKVRGYRIELEEIEARLGAHPDVSAAVAAAPLGRDGERVLAGYVVAGDGVDGTVLREWCAQTLPGYLVPEAWILLDALPTTPNGKIDRKSLPGLEAAGGVATGTTTAPATDTERKVAAIFGEVLELPGVGVDASFFDLGGHSLRALRVVLKIRDELGVDVGVAALIRASTVRRLAEVIDRSGSDRSGSGGGRHLAVPLNTEGNRPLFVFHPLGGHIFGYRPLAEMLDGVATVYGVRAGGMEAGEEPVESIGQLVDRYLEELRGVQPQGPYRLAGWCMGATVALETARRLRAEGEDVAFLGLVVANPFDPAPRQLLDNRTDLVLHAMGYNLDVDYAELAAIEDLERQVDFLFNSGRHSGALREDVASRDDALRLLRVYQANATAISSHAFEPFDGTAHVFVLPEEKPAPDDMGWSSILVGPTSRHDLPGRAETFLDADFVATLAGIIGAEITGDREPSAPTAGRP